jgi:hypothetical protein
MKSTRTWWRALAAALVAAGIASAHAQPMTQPMYVPPFVKSRLVQVDVYDRQDGRALPVYQKDGRHYIEGVPGHEYAVRIRNTTGGRVLVVTSVDGVNVISGDTAAPSQSGYVLDPWGSVEIGGWRKSLSRTAAFYFTDLGDSYAARTGRPQNVGVIGVAVFEERPRPRIAQPRDYDYRARKDQGAAAEADAPAPMKERGEAQSVPPPPAAAPAPSATTEAPRQNYADEMKSLGKLGTGHGRSEESRVTVVNFERATSYPAETVAIQYDRRENLLAMGVIPRDLPYIARNPNPFPGMRFAPDPR